MAKSKFQQAQEDYPRVTSALNMFPPTRMAIGVGNVIDQASQGNYRNAIKDTLVGMAPPIVGQAYNYAMNDKQDPNAASVEDRSTYSPEMQTERAATDATYYSDFGGGGVDNKGMDTRESLDYKRGGKVKAYAKGGAVSKKPVKSTRGRGDGIAQRGHTKGRII